MLLKLLDNTQVLLLLLYLHYNQNVFIKKSSLEHKTPVLYSPRLYNISKMNE